MNVTSIIEVVKWLVEHDYMDPDSGALAIGEAVLTDSDKKAGAQIVPMRDTSPPGTEQRATFRKRRSPSTTRPRPTWQGIPLREGWLRYVLTAVTKLSATFPEGADAKVVRSQCMGDPKASTVGSCLTWAKQYGLVLHNPDTGLWRISQRGVSYLDQYSK